MFLTVILRIWDQEISFVDGWWGSEIWNSYLLVYVRELVSDLSSLIYWTYVYEFEIVVFFIWVYQICVLSGFAFEFLVTTPLVAQRPGENHRNSKLCPLIRNNGGYKLVGTGNKSAPYDSSQFSRWSHQQEPHTLRTKQLWQTVSLVQFCAWQIRHGVAQQLMI